MCRYLKIEKTFSIWKFPNSTNSYSIDRSVNIGKKFLVFQAAELSFSYCVTQATGLAVGGDWDFTDQPMKSYRTVMLIPKTKWKNILSKIAVMVG